MSGSNRERNTMNTDSYLIIKQTFIRKHEILLKIGNEICKDIFYK